MFSKTASLLPFSFSNFAIGSKIYKYLVNCAVQNTIILIFLLSGFLRLSYLTTFALADGHHDSKKRSRNYEKPTSCCATCFNSPRPPLEREMKEVGTCRANMKTSHIHVWISRLKIVRRSSATFVLQHVKGPLVLGLESHDEMMGGDHSTTLLICLAHEDVVQT